MAKVQIYSGGSTSPSGISGSIQFNDNGAFGSDATKLFWDDTNNRLGIGTNAPAATLGIQGSGSDIVRLMSADGTRNTFFTNSGYLGIQVYPTAPLHVKGLNDSTGSSAIIQSATYELINAYNNRQVVIGAGSAATTTNLTINPGGVGANTTDYNLKVIGTGSDNLFYVSNGNGWTSAGVYIYRSTNSSRTALTVGSTQSGSGTFYVNSAGVIGFSATYSPIAQFDMPLSIGMSASTTYKGAVFQLWNDNAAGFHFTKSGYSSNVGFFNIDPVWTYPNLSATAINFKINPTVNFTGTGVHDFIGINYNPTMTSITGKHYGLLIRSGLSGFGLGATLPTATITIAASTTANAPLNIAAGTAPTAPNDGDIWTEGTDLKIRLGGTTYTVTKTV